MSPHTQIRTSRLWRFFNFFIPLTETGTRGDSVFDEAAFRKARGKYLNRTAAGFALIDGTLMVLDFGPYHGWAWALLPLGAIMAGLLGAALRMTFEKD